MFMFGACVYWCEQMYVHRFVEFRGSHQVSSLTPHPIFLSQGLSLILELDDLPRLAKLLCLSQHCAAENLNCPD